MCDAKLIAALILVWPQNIILLPARVFRNIILTLLAVLADGWHTCVRTVFSSRRPLFMTRTTHVDVGSGPERSEDSNLDSDSGYRD